MRGCCDESAEDKGSGCGVVINVVDRGVWSTICKIALQLEECSELDECSAAQARAVN